MTQGQRKKLEAYSIGDLPLNRAIRASTARIDALEAALDEAIEALDTVAVDGTDRRRLWRLRRIANGEET